MGGTTTSSITVERRKHCDSEIDIDLVGRKKAIGLTATAPRHSDSPGLVLKGLTTD